MATVAELKSQITSLEQKINLLQPALKQAEATLAQAAKALGDFQSQPANVTLSELTKARNASDADPTNAELKQQYQVVQAKWDARQAIYLPLLRARDAAFDAAVAARSPIVELDSQIAELEIAIASVNPNEASPDAVAAAKEKAAAQEKVTAPVNGTAQVTSTGTVKTTTAAGIQKETAVPGIASTSTSVTNPSASDAASAAKMANPQNIVGGDTLDEVQITATKIPADAKVSSEPANVAPAFAKFKNGDKRVRLIVPPSYLIGPAAGPSPSKNTSQGVLQLNGGIVFPYLPQINLEYSSNWTENQAVHSNYKQYFFKSSSPGEIGLTAKFSVQNSFEAGTLLAVQHLLRALIKMPFGSDPNAGSPPPICRLLAHGDYMLDGVPVAVKSFKLDYPADVDYFTLDKDPVYGVTSVPVLTSLSLTLIPVYSRNEMLNGSTTGWLTGGQRIQGYL